MTSRTGTTAFVIAVAAWIGGVVLFFINDRRAAAEIDLPKTSWDVSEGGYSLLSAYLDERHGGRVLTTRVTESLVPEDAVVFRLSPSFESFRPAWLDAIEGEKDKEVARPADFLSAAEAAWIERGGRLVLGIEAPYASIDVHRITDPVVVRRTSPRWRGVDTVDPVRPGRLSGKPLDRAVTRFAANEFPAVSTIAIGKGEVVIVSSPDIFENGRLGKGDHLALVEHLVAGRTGVYFDEYIHGVQDEAGVFALLARDWKLGPAMVLLALAALTAFFRRVRSLGRPDREPSETRSEAVDLVESLGSFYDSAVSDAEALDLYYRSLIRATAMKTGAHGDLLRAKIRELSGGRDLRSPRVGRMTSESFKKRLTAINEAFRRLGHADNR